MTTPYAGYLISTVALYSTPSAITVISLLSADADETDRERKTPAAAKRKAIKRVNVKNDFLRALMLLVCEKMDFLFADLSYRPFFTHRRIKKTVFPVAKALIICYYIIMLYRAGSRAARLAKFIRRFFYEY